MSYFEDQEDAWAANDFKGSPDQYDPYTDGTGLQRATPPPCTAETRVFRQLKKHADGKGLKCFHHGNGHFQLVAGRMKINWYPLSRKQVAYNSLTSEKRYRLNAKQVVEFALEKIETVQ